MLRRKQRGVTLVVITIALFSLIVVGGLALDIGHVMVNKSRLQATVDAAALSAAKVLDVTGSTTQATTAATNVLSLNAQNHSELWSAYGSVTKTVEYSNTLIPFAPGTTPPLYVRVKASGFSMAATLASVAGINTFTVAATAVAGPSPTINKACNIAPMLMCGTPLPAGTPPSNTNFYGYTKGEITVLKYAGGGGGAGVGPGNYMLLDDGSGGAAVRQALAGSYSSCATVNNTVTTETGVAAGPTAQGINTRFNEYQGPSGLTQSAYPPDVITNQPTSKNSRLSCSDKSCTTVVTGSPSQTVTDYTGYTSWNYENMYQPALQSGSYNVPPPTGVPERRILAVPIGDCTTAGAGKSNVTVLGLACVFLLQDVDQSDANVFGEVLGKCQVNGNPGPAPTSSPGPYKIQLYHVDGSPES
jgi:Flp pilus assembly protein TadG